MSFVFIDESGDLGVGGSKYLVLAALVVEDCLPLNRIVKNIRRYKFRKLLAGISEIRAHNVKKEVVRYLLSSLNQVQGVKITYVILEKKKVISKYLKDNPNTLYDFVAGKLAKNLTFESKVIEVKVDKSKSKQSLEKEFNECFKRHLRPQDLLKLKIISHSYSHAWIGLQFADLLAWSCFQKFEFSNSEFIDLLKVDQEIIQVW